MRIVRTKLFFSLIAGALLAAGVTSVAMAAQPQARGRACYSTCSTRTSLSVRPNIVHYGRENRARFSVAVRPSISGIGFARGTVAMKAGSITLCTIRLSRGTGSCSPGRRALRPQRRPYLIQAFYGGSKVFSHSKSQKQILWVFP